MVSKRELLTVLAVALLESELVPAKPLNLTALAERPLSTAATVQAEPTPASPCLDPVPDPMAAGWVKYGAQNVIPGLSVTDHSSGLGDYVTLACEHATLFQAETRLAISFFLSSSDGPPLASGLEETGVHVTMDDGDRRIRVTLLRDVASSRLAIETVGGYAPLFTMPIAGGPFVLRRLVDGTAVVEVLGHGRSQIVPHLLPPSSHPGTRAISFGTFDGPTTSWTEWSTLGLPRLGTGPVVLPGAVIGVPQRVWLDTYPTAMAVDDLTPDDYADVAVVGWRGAATLVNDGSGSFASGSPFPSAGSSKAVASGDFNGDGRLDLAIASPAVGAAPGTVSVLFATGPATFGSPSPHTVGIDPQAIAAGDMNGDGHLDLAVANQFSGDVSILMGTATGSFAAAMHAPAGNYPVAIGLGDFDGDGDLDVATAGEDNAMNVLLNNGTGLGAPASYVVGHLPQALAVDDLNADGKPDVVVGNADQRVSLLFGVGNGSLQPAIDVPLAAQPRSVAVGDLTGDGRPDLVIGDSGDSLYVMPATNAGQFGAASRVAVGPGFSRPLALRDLNGDGTLDILTGNEMSADLSVLFVTQHSDIPVAGYQAVATNEDTPLVITLTGTAAEGRSLSFTVLAPPAHGSLTGTAPNLTYIPSAHFSGRDSLTFRVNDGEADSNIAMVTINVHAVNDPPTLTVPGPQIVGEGEPLSFTVAASDLETAVGIFAPVLPVGATFDGTRFTWTPNIRQAGTHSIAFDAFDGIDTVTKTVSIVVEDGPVPAGCFDPVPNPLTTGWIREGPEPFYAMAPLSLSDSMSSFGHFVNFYCIDETRFANEIRLQVRLSATYWSVNNSGVHVTINDGERMIRAMLFGEFGGVRVAVQLIGHNNYTLGFFLPGAVAEFVLRRLPDGSAVLEAPGQTAQPIRYIDLALAERPGVKTLEFGTTADNFSASSVDVYSLGLPPVMPSRVALPAASPNAVPFEAAVSFAAGYTPVAIEAADFNRDGALDLATANHNGRDISIHLGNGTGGFSAPTSFPVAMSASTLASGDLNGDGILDLVAGGYNSNQVVVLLGNGSGEFSVTTNVTVGTSPTSLVLADVTGDGKLDLAVAYSYGATVSILPGDGAGSFGAIRHQHAGNASEALIAMDWNSDGRLDLAAANRLDDTVSVIHGDGTGSFNRPRVSALVPSLPRMLAAGDFNGDGRTDLAVGVHHTQMVSILLNDGAGGFGAPVHYAVGSYLASLAVADFNGDDSPDVAIGHGIAENSRVSILLGDGTGALVAAAGFPISSTPYDLAVGDFNHDGKQDLAAANAYFSIVELLLSRSNRPPVANAGPDQRVDYNPAGMTRVTLDGGASADPDGGSLTYRWSGPFPEGGGIVTGRDPVVTLPIGVSPITLVVNDGAVDSGADPMTVHVTVRPTGLVDPLAALVPEGQIAPLPKKAFAVGKTVPLKLWLFSGWTALTSQQVAPPRIVSALRDGTPIPLPGLNLTAGQAFQYQERDRSWLLDVPTRGWTPGTYTVVIEMPDSRRFAARFVVR